MANEFQEFLQTLKDKSNIVEVAAGYMSLERKGATYWACCPFHHEKTPSFAVNEADQFYHCFGCGESGDVIKLVQGMENLEFMDAAKLLADRAGIELPKSNYDNQQTVEIKRKKDACLKILNDTAHFYLNNLNSGKADAHLAYIQKRRIPFDIIRRFGLGASLDFYQLPKYLLNKGYDKRDMVDCGVVNESGGKLTDAQGGRLIFPIINAMNEVIAFGGRALEKTDFGKYKNTKDTFIFNKRKTLYNINLLKKLKREQTISEVIIVEGYMDTLSLYGAGFKNVVASMGTSLTQDQARLLKRYTEHVYISYDGDGAGQKANMRGLDVLRGEGLNVKVVPLPDGLDPDDVIKQRGVAGYQACIDGALPLIDYKIKSVGQGLDLNDPEDKRAYVAEALKIISTVESAVAQEDLLKALNRSTGVSYESLKRDLGVGGKIKQPQQKTAPQIRKDKSSVADKASRFIIAAFLFGAKFTADYPLDGIPFSCGVHEITAKYIKSKRLFEERVQPAELFEFFPDDTEEYTELTKILDYCDGTALSEPNAEKYFKDCIKTLKLAKKDAEIDALNAKIAGAGSTEEAKALAAQLNTLLKQKEKIKSGET